MAAVYQNISLWGPRAYAPLETEQYELTPSYVELFKAYIEARPDEQGLEAALQQGHDLRHLSGQKTRFWQLSRKKLNRQFDAIYAKGVARLAEARLKEPHPLEKLEHRYISEPQRPGLLRAVGKGAAIGLGAVGGWAFAYPFSRSMSNLIPHEYAHRWAWMLMRENADPEVHAIAIENWEKGGFWRWLSGTRKGNTGNFVRFSPLDPTKPSPLSPWGSELTPFQQELFLMGAGLGAELVYNSLLAATGFALMKSKQRVLGASVLGFTLLSHSASHSYIRRYLSYSETKLETNTSDPARISSLLASELGCSRVEALKALNVAYALFPVAILATLYFLTWNQGPDIPDEAVMMHLLSKEDLTYDQQKVLMQAVINLEMEMEPELAALNSSALLLQEKGGAVTKEEERHFRRQQRVLYAKFVGKLTHELKNEKLFKRVKSELEKELKGVINSHLPPTVQVRFIASLSAMLAYGLRSISTEILPAFVGAVRVLTPLVIVAQAVVSIIDLIQMISDLRNENLSKKGKILSVAKTALSLVAGTLVCLSLFLSGLGMVIFLAILGASLMSAFLGYLQHREMRHLATVREQIADTPEWQVRFEDAGDVLEQLASAPGRTLFIKQDDESQEEYLARLQEIEEAFEWLQAQREGLESDRLSKGQREAIEPLFEQYCAIPSLVWVKVARELPKCLHQWAFGSSSHEVVKEGERRTVLGFHP